MATAEQIQAGLAHLIDRLSFEERDLLRKWVAIPNKPDCSAYIMGLEAREGQPRVSQISDRLEAVRVELGVRYDELQKMAQQMLGVQELP